MHRRAPAKMSPDVTLKPWHPHPNYRALLYTFCHSPTWCACQIGTTTPGVAQF